MKVYGNRREMVVMVHGFYYANGHGWLLLCCDISTLIRQQELGELVGGTEPFTLWNIKFLLLYITRNSCKLKEFLFVPRICFISAMKPKIFML